MSNPSTLETTGRRTAVHTPGAFVWHEVRTKDIAKAQAFYGSLFGWTFTNAEMPGMDYFLIEIGNKHFGGMMDITDHGMPPHVGAFISVADVDQAAAAVTAAGGEVCFGPQDIPGVGRFAEIIDPQGAHVAIYKDLKGDPDTADTDAHEFCWDQLNTTDMAGAAAFYQKVVGWTAEQPSPEMGLFKMGELMEASLGPVPEGVPPHWLSFIAVTDLTAMTAKARSLGATVLMADLPAGPFGRFSVIQDPTGVVFGLFQGNER